jgi:hypothetical protein
VKNADKKFYPLPSIVSPIAPDLRRFLDRVKETYDDPNGLVTKQDLIDTGSFQNNSIGNLEYIEPGEEQSYITPPAPLNLAASGAMTSIVVTWDGINYNSGYAYTEVWRASVDNLGVSVLIGTTISGMYTDAVGSDASHYYWVRFVNVLNDIGPFNAISGVLGETSPDVAYLLSQLTASITNSQLYSTLAESINSTFHQNDAPTTKKDGTTLVAGDIWIDADDNDAVHLYNGTAWGAAGVATQAYVGTEITQQVGYCERTVTAGGAKNVATAYTTQALCAAASVSGETFAWKDDAALAGEVKTVTTTATGNTAAATAAQDAADAAQDDATEALGDLSDIAADDKVTPVEKLQAKTLWEGIEDEKTSLLASAVNAGVIGNTYLTGNITSTQTSIPVSNATTGFNSSGYVTIQDEIVQYSSRSSTMFLGCTRGYGTSDNAAHVSLVDVNSSVSPKNYTGQYILLDTYLNSTLHSGSGLFTYMTVNTTVVRSTWNDTWNAYYTSKQALMDAIAAGVKTIADANTATIQVQTTSINGIEAKHTVKIDNNGYVTGYGLISTANNGSPTSEFAIVADQFSIAPVNTSNTATDGSPFFHRTSSTVINGATIPAGTYMKGAFIHDATITTAKIGALAVDAAKIANATIVNAKIADGTIETAKIKDANITTAKILDANITTAKIGDAQITNAKIGNTIQSASYSAGSAGWKIDKTGEMEMNNATFRGTLAVGGTASNRMNITSDKIEIYNGGTLRVKLGNLA